MVLRKEQAETIRAQVRFHFIPWITLDAHSALDSVGLTAVITRVLADAGIVMS